MLVKRREDQTVISVVPTSVQNKIYFKDADGKCYEWKDLEVLTSTSMESAQAVPFKVHMKSTGSMQTIPGKPIIEIHEAIISNDRLIGKIFEHHKLQGITEEGKTIMTSEIVARTEDKIETLNTVYLIRSWG